MLYGLAGKPSHRFTRDLRFAIHMRLPFHLEEGHCPIGSIFNFERALCALRERM
jgi:hypothetical protein